MAEDTQNQNQAAGAGAEPAFDPEKMRSLIREELQQAMSTTDKDAGYVDSQPASRPQATENPLQAVIDPLIAPHIVKANLAAEGARDAATFYVSVPEAVKYQKEIEQIFNAMITQGTPFTRQAVWEWYRGKNFDKFVQEARQADEKKISDAKNIVDAGGGLRPSGGPVKDAHSATDEELKNALNGVTF
jgi:hypothetical protein